MPFGSFNVLIFLFSLLTRLMCSVRNERVFPWFGSKFAKLFDIPVRFSRPVYRFSSRRVTFELFTNLRTLNSQCLFSLNKQAKQTA